ncbi:hypothetical protein J6590_104917 [Homalodisca vitripennis]|nr:hypothetical protein J6590_104917 [Homalodisca vitripennis]
MTYASAETSSHQLLPTPDWATSAGLSTPSGPSSLEHLDPSCGGNHGRLQCWIGECRGQQAIK